MLKVRLGNLVLGFPMLIKSGLRVFATARRLSSMDPLQELGIECLKLDATKIDDIRQVRDHVANLCGSLDILVNNA
jgi:1-acylglycerone phosphate reductase